MKTTQSHSEATVTLAANEAAYLAAELQEARAMLCEARRLLEHCDHPAYREEAERWCEEFDSDDLLVDMFLGEDRGAA